MELFLPLLVLKKSFCVRDITAKMRFFKNGNTSRILEIDLFSLCDMQSVFETLILSLLM